MFKGAKLALFIGADLAVILRDDRPDIPFPNHWDLPGGGREGDETPLQCALRETEEELGLTLAANEVVWGRRFDLNWFFAAHLPPVRAQDIVLGDEGQRWSLMSAHDFLHHSRAVPQFQTRLAIYLAGMAGKSFERPPATGGGSGRAAGSAGPSGRNA